MNFLVAVSLCQLDNPRQKQSQGDYRAQLLPDKVSPSKIVVDLLGEFSAGVVQNDDDFLQQLWRHCGHYRVNCSQTN